MARQQGIKKVNKFIRGLITESTPFQFPEDACTEASNCVFSSIGQVTRRAGMDIEVGGVEVERLGSASTDAYTQFVWPSVAGTGDLTFVVVQQGNLISFYDISVSVDAISTNKKDFVIDLSDYTVDNSALNPSEHKCSYAFGDGRLIIVNKASEPILVQYDEETETITVSEINIEYRDFAGLDDGLSITSRPIGTVAALKTSNAQHYYNILNQGWHSTTALSDWDTARADLPSNADMVSLYRASATDTFDNANVTANSPGNTQAPRGHFILDAFYPNRTQAMIDEGFTGAAVGNSGTDINLAALTTISSSVSSVANLFDSNSSTTATFSSSGNLLASTIAYAGKTLSSSKKIYKATLVVTTKTATVNSDRTYVVLRAKTGVAPTSQNDGTLLGSTVIQNAGPITIDVISTDLVNSYDHVWVCVFSGDTTDPSTTVASSLSFQEVSLTEQAITYTRPTTTCFFAGRAWYAGNDGLGLNNTLFFSQIIQRKDQYGKCYQANDPTSENFVDLLQDDGGTIKIAEAADIVHIGNYGNAVLVFATNGVWAVTGSARQYFTATSFGVRKISSIGTASNSSFVEFEGMPIWWGEAGIYTIKHDPNYDAYSVQNLTEMTIQSFITDIPSYNRTFVKGSYNPYTKSITWLYNDATTLATADRFKFNKALQFNTLSQSFYPFEIGTNDGVVPDIRGIITCKPSSEAVPPSTKFFSTITVAGEENGLFAELNDLNYTDWASYEATDYDSYFIMGWNIEADGARSFQTNYVHVFMEEETNASVFVSSRFDWGSNASSGKFSTTQQAYNDRWDNRALRVSKLKMRGSGQAVQIKFESESGKPFTIVGWSMMETSNAGV